MKISFRTAVAAAAFLVTLGAGSAVASVLAACSSEDEGTTGKRVALTMAVTGSPGATAPFTNAAGWSVTLSKAFVATGPLYLYDGATIFSRSTPSDLLLRYVTIAEALAHPGHYVPGNARGEFLPPSSVDLRAPAELGLGNGVSGLVRSATFTFSTPAVGPFSAELGAHVAVLEGRADKAGEARFFRAEIDAADVANTKGQPAIEGCPFTEADVQGDGTVTLTFEVERWFDQVEFDTLPAGSDGQPALMPGGALGRNELVRGMKEGLGYAFSFAAR